MATSSDLYKQSGVDIDAMNRAVELMRSAVTSTHGPRVLSRAGLFGGAYAIDGATILIASTDSVGSKLRLAALVGRHSTSGVDLVNHCVNDILTMGARPLFFLDYYASSRLVPEIVVDVVQGLAEACREAGCALLGGETAELPGMYIEGEYDLAGFIVGSVRADRILDGQRVRAGDVLIGLPSSGLHTNGFTLVHHILSAGGARAVTGEMLREPVPALGQSLEAALLVPHRCYLRDLEPVLDEGLISGAAHITGGGLLENLPRVLPDGLSARVDTASWAPAQIFEWLQREGGVSTREMYRVFNMGVGMVLVVAPESVDACRRRLQDAWVLGEVTPGVGVTLDGVPDA